MKYAIIIPDGCADEPQDSLNGRTPLEAANIPAMDQIATSGMVGRANHVPAHLPAGSAVANMTLLGYDPEQYFTGRAPLEAAAQGIELGPQDWAVRCNLVTVLEQTMRDFTADHISTEEATQLLAAIQAELSSDRWQFVPGVSYRNLLLYRGDNSPPPFSMETRCTPPHDLTDKSVTDDFPRGPGSDFLTDCMTRSMQLFEDHPVNRSRTAAGRLPATNIWLWGLGKTPALPTFQECFGVKGKMITAVDLLRGIAALIGWPRIEVEGATGYTDTDYAAKGQAAIQALNETDLICVHVEATDEASHEGDVDAKITSLEAIDQQIVAPLHEALQAQGDYRILITPDHPTPIRTKTHSHGFVPFAMTGQGITRDNHRTYDEPTAGASEHSYEEGFRLMPTFIGE
ncbi:MAG: cofactor-independent phosphoglycerate mutase [Pirellulaceae bacterium]|nr:cofactor-independent phosphoglycerate mutase [Pirellulaceae bacterium]